MSCGAASAATGAPFSVKRMVRGALGHLNASAQRLAGGSAQRAVDRLRRQRQLGEAHADRVLDRVGDRRRDAERARSRRRPWRRTGRCRRPPSTISFTISARQVAEARDLVVGERAVRELPVAELHLSDMVKPSCMMAAPESCVSTMRGLIAVPTSATLTSRSTRNCPVSVSTSTSAPVAPTIQNGVDVGRQAGVVVGRLIARHDSCRCRRCCRPACRICGGTARRPGTLLPGGRPSSGASAASLAGAHPRRRADGIAHVIGRARAERAHVVGRHVGVGMDDAHPLGRRCPAPRRRSAPSPCRSPGPYRRCRSRGRSCRRRRD